MSEDTATEQTPAAIGEKWGDPIDEARKQELWARLRAWWDEADHGERKGPFAGERLTGATVFWLAVCALAKQEDTPPDQAEQRLRSEWYRFLGYQLNLSLLALVSADLSGAQLQGALLSRAQLQGALLDDAHLEQAILNDAQLERAILNDAQLQGANLFRAQLQGADLSGTQLQGTDLSRAQLQKADLRKARVNAETLFTGVALCAHPFWLWRLVHPWAPPTAPSLGDVRWSGVGTVDLTQITDWDAVDRLGDERGVNWLDLGGNQHQDVVRAYRQVATQLRAQGMTDAADRLSHRALSYERRVFLRRGNIPRLIGSWLLAILAGYGYRPGRTLFWYLVVIGGFALGYFQATHGVLTFGLAPSQVQPLQWYEALILSISAFHGRGFFQQVQSLGDPVAILAAMEAVIGLLIEISFIATFTQRFFGSK